eukprot:4728978-Pyramimonas_sp.AAC.2
MQSLIDVQDSVEDWTPANKEGDESEERCLKTLLTTLTPLLNKQTTNRKKYETRENDAPTTLTN